MNDFIKGFKAEPERIYKFECGCIGHVEQKNHKLLCPEHGKPAICKIINCPDCGKELEINMRSQRVRCVECQKKKSTTRQREYMKDYVKGNSYPNRNVKSSRPSPVGSPESHADCLFRDVCHDIECKQCLKYVSKKKIKTLRYQDRLADDKIMTSGQKVAYELEFVAFGEMYRPESR